MPGSPEELLRSIERTREELALTVDTIAGRLDPKRAARRGVDKVKAGTANVIDGARTMPKPVIGGGLAALVALAALLAWRASRREGE